MSAPFNDSPPNSAKATSDLPWTALGLSTLLLVHCVVWELWGAPTGSGTLALKAVPLIWPLSSIYRNRLRGHQVMSLWVWFYLMEGCVRVWSDPPAVRAWAAVEIFLSLAAFAACTVHLRRTKTPKPST